MYLATLSDTGESGIIRQEGSFPGWARYSGHLLTGPQNEGALAVTWQLPTQFSHLPSQPITNQPIIHFLHSKLFMFFHSL